MVEVLIQKRLHGLLNLIVASQAPGMRMEVDFTFDHNGNAEVMAVQIRGFMARRRKGKLMGRLEGKFFN